MRMRIMMTTMLMMMTMKTTKIMTTMKLLERMKHGRNCKFAAIKKGGLRGAVFKTEEAQVAVKSSCQAGTDSRESASRGCFEERHR
eukprot:10300586-Karenia_brevis.AAC.1